MSSFDDEQLISLAQDLRSGPVNRCKAALDALARCPSERAVPLLAQIAQDGEFLRRRFAVMGLGNHPTAESFQVLRTMAFREQDANVLAEIANSLFEFYGASATPEASMALPLIQEMFDRNPHWLLRQSVIAMVMESDRDDILLNMVQKALQDPEQSVIETGILALGRLLKGSEASEALNLLETLVQNENWRCRWRAATALRLSPDPRAKALLAQLRQDPHHRVVAAALEGSLDGESASG